MKRSSTKPAPGSGWGWWGGSAFHFLKGLCRSPNGARLAGACRAVHLNAPRVGGKFAAWYGLSATFACALLFARQTDDPCNWLAATAAASGLLSLRRGLGASAWFAALGGATVALPLVGFIWASKFDADWEDKRARNS